VEGGDGSGWIGLTKARAGPKGNFALGSNEKPKVEKRKSEKKTEKKSVLEGQHKEGGEIEF